ncbi:Isoleucyl-tRNA synthetase IleS [Helicobacter heilmannii]|uniref:isoleucine--tRNA ligase n=1 Tax=Helicobacter heilmannii TaxID=35817 RepID=UPI00244D9230|nr:isoleucine--tRNA ligase [Helicobacter heilmannii]GMB95068.1 Isoleucyl-tRNA synthetase IleS [Helicobacter heilmannii]
MDYKDTLILPTTTFPMRANLGQNAPKVYAKWQEEGIYAHMQVKRKGQASFNLHDGPPYANGHLHIGHALNKILKDVVVKHHYFAGHAIDYTPGWDCHGLPIEQQVEKEFKDKDNILEFRKHCYEHAKQFIDIQRDEFLQLGVVGDYHHPYETLDHTFEASIYDMLCIVAKKGLLKQRFKPVYWSWACQSALAEAEVEYKDKQSDSIFVAFNLNPKSAELLAQEAHFSVEQTPKDFSLVIWTTTPWTLPANTAIALKPKTTYAITSAGQIAALELAPKLLEKGILKGTIVGSFESNLLEKQEALNPLNGRTSLVVLGAHVSLEEGSGAVHTAPGHGEEDYFLGLDYGLEVLMPVDDFGCYNEEILEKKLLPKEFLGAHVLKIQPKILELLGENLLHHSVITHSYPHCWRTHEPILYRATTQWFILMDEPFLQPDGSKKTLRQVALEAIEGVEFYPKQGKNRLRAMIEQRPDWCVSRQRSWGVPMAFFVDKQNQEPLFEPAILEHIKDIFTKKGCNAWWEAEIADLLPQDFKHLAPKLEKNPHILDVWFDSGSTFKAVCEERLNLYPSDLVLEGSDQHRGWFQSSLLLSCVAHSRAPFKVVLTHGFTVDEKGHKMSKSKGNVISLEHILNTYGSDILRLWVVLNDYQNDLSVSDAFFKQTADSYKKIRNTLRFLLANIADLESLSLLNPLDEWILAQSAQVFGQVQTHFQAYDFVKGLQKLLAFIANELSGIYMDIGKDSLYCDAKNSPKRRGIQTAMLHLAHQLSFLLAPILTYTIEEVFSHASPLFKEVALSGTSVFDLKQPTLHPNEALLEEFKTPLHLRTLFSEALDSLKKDKQVKTSLELEIHLKEPGNFKHYTEWLMVSSVCAKQDNALLDTPTFTLYRAKAHKCPRCWQFTSHSAQEPCNRCAKVLEHA